MAEEYEEMVEMKDLSDLEGVYESMAVDALKRAMGLSPTMGNLVYAAIATTAVIEVSFNLFRYKSNKIALAYGDISGETNWWEIGLYVDMYTKLTLWSVALITQILSMFGIAVSVNGLVWQWAS